VDEGRLQALSDFQTAILSHAMRFPSVHIIAYSTCSIHLQENEWVVSRVLAKPEFADWTLKRSLSSWPRRGLVCDGISQGKSAFFRQTRRLDLASRPSGLYDSLLAGGWHAAWLLCSCLTQRRRVAGHHRHVNFLRASTNATVWRAK
jgi:hypothetical protein